MPTANLQVSPPRRAPAKSSRKKFSSERIPAPLDLGAVDGSHLHFRLHLYPHYHLGFLVPMGYTAN